MQTTDYSSTGAFCAIHPQRGAVATCDHCGTFACPECITLEGERQICATCIREGRVQLGANPWERRGELGWGAAYMQTILAVTSSPGQFYRSMTSRGSVGEALLFYALVLVPALALAAMYGQFMLFALGDQLLALFDAFAAFAAQNGSPMPPEVRKAVEEAIEPSVGRVGQAMVFNVLVWGAIWLLASLVFGLVQHAILTIVGGAKHDLETSLRACLYAGGVRFWEVIPLVTWIGMPWMLTVQAVGLARAHETDGWRGGLAAWGPALGCCCCAFVLGMTPGLLLAIAGGP